MTPIRVRKGEPPFFHRPPKPADIQVEGDQLLLTRPDGKSIEIIPFDRTSLESRLRSKRDAIERAGRHGLNISATSLFLYIYNMELAAFSSSREQEEVEHEK